MRYFAYGSNMFTKRLRGRVPSAQFLAAGALKGYALRFHKRSNDGSAKCNALWTHSPKDEVLGVIFDYCDSEKPGLDRAEGLGEGYDETEVNVLTDRGEIRAHIYVAAQTHIDETLAPYEWYKELVLAGTREHGLPPEYVAGIERVRGVDDPDPARDRRERAIVGSDG
jgi:gamma-glutamylcyclotransferase (GGCT)/AIG2-like uncharacterized protein YtfP